MTKAEYIERYGEEAYLKRLERQKERYENNRDKILEQVKAYREANPDKVAEQKKRYREANKGKIAEYYRCWKQENQDKVAEYQKMFRKTKNGRANYLLNAYRQTDKKYNRGECTLTSQWIIDHIFSGQVCQYCGESDWEKLGCDRIDNNLPHTPDNVVCSCWDCNNKRGDKPYEDFVKECNKQSA